MNHLLDQKAGNMDISKNRTKESKWHILIVIYGIIPANKENPVRSLEEGIKLFDYLGWEGR